MIGEKIGRRHVDQILRRMDTGIGKTPSGFNTEPNEDYMSSLGSQQVSSAVTQSNDDTTNTEVNIQRETQPPYFSKE